MVNMTQVKSDLMTIVTNRRDQPCGPESDRDDGEEDCNHIDRVPSIFEELAEAHFLEKVQKASWSPSSSISEVTFRTARLLRR